MQHQVGVVTSAVAAYCLCKQACDHASQDVSGASGGHAWIAGGVDPHTSHRISHNGVMALQYNDAVVSGRKLACCVHAVLLNLGDGEPGETRHLAGMWRDDQGP